MRNTAIALCLLLAAAPASRAASGGHDDHDAHAEPVPTGAELRERCERYAESLAFTREQLKRRTLLGRWNVLRSRHRERERFHEEHCRGEMQARGDGQGAAQG